MTTLRPPSADTTAAAHTSSPPSSPLPSSECAGAVPMSSSSSSSFSSSVSYSTFPPASHHAKGVPLAAASSLPLLPPEISSCRTAEIKAAALRHERVNKRAFEAMRPVYMHTRFGASSGAAGSAYVSLGNTKVTCAVYGPRPSVLSSTSECAKLSVDIRVWPFAVGSDGEAAAFDRNKGGGSTEEGILTAGLQQALERVVLLSRYPKAFIDVYVLILEDAGGVLPAALTCAGLAAADAGLEMLDILTGASACGFTLLDPASNRRRVLTMLDPEPEERNALEGDDLTVVDVAFCPGIFSVCFARARGPLLSSAGIAQQEKGVDRLFVWGVAGNVSDVISIEASNALLEQHGGTNTLFGLCEAACEALAEEVRDCLRNSFTSRQRLRVLQQQRSDSPQEQLEMQHAADQGI